MVTPSRFPLRTRSGKELAVVRAEFRLPMPDDPPEQIDVPLDVKVGRFTYRVVLELPRAVRGCERIRYEHKGITLGPTGVEGGRARARRQRQARGDAKGGLPVGLTIARREV